MAFKKKDTKPAPNTIQKRFITSKKKKSGSAAEGVPFGLDAIEQCMKRLYSSAYSY